MTASIKPYPNSLPVASEAIELLQIWKTWLGSSRNQCDEHGKRLWDRIESVVSSQSEVSVTTTDGTIPLGAKELNALRAAHEPFRGMEAPAGVDADELLALLDTIDALLAKLQATNARMADQERRRDQLLSACQPFADGFLRSAAHEYEGASQSEANGFDRNTVTPQVLMGDYRRLNAAVQEFKK